MSGWLLILVAGIYAYAAVEQIWRGNAAMSVILFSYAVSNTAFFFLTK